MVVYLEPNGKKLYYIHVPVNDLYAIQANKINATSWIDNSVSCFHHVMYILYHSTNICNQQLVYCIFISITTDVIRMKLGRCVEHYYLNYAHTVSRPPGRPLRTPQTRPAAVTWPVYLMTVLDQRRQSNLI